MRTVILILGSFLLTLSAADLELGKDAQKAKDNYEAKVAEVISEVKEELKDEKASLIKSLEKELKSVTKKGDLDGATAIQARIDELNKESSQENAGLFGAPSEKKSASSNKKGSDITVLRAFVKSQATGQMINVTKQIQSLVDSGKNSITAQKDLKDTGVEGRATFLIEYEIDGKKYQKRLGWGFPAILEAK